MRSEILKLIITAVILESIIYIYGTYDPLGSENIHMLFINPVIYGAIPVIIYYFYKNRWITGKCNEIKSMVIIALFLTVTYSLITLFLDSYLFLLYSFENSSDELSLVNIEHDEYLNSGFKLIFSSYINGLNLHIIINSGISIVLILLVKIIYMKMYKKYICDYSSENNTKYMMKHSFILICILTLYKIFADVLVYLLFDYLNI